MTPSKPSVPVSGRVPALPEDTETDNPTLERARELMVVLRKTTDELGTLYGPLWHGRQGLLGRAEEADGRLASLVADHDGTLGVWVCEGCGGPLDAGRCGCGKATGMAVHTSDLVQRLTEAEAERDEAKQLLREARPHVRGAFRRNSLADRINGFLWGGR